MKKHIQILINTLFISVFLFSFLSCNDTQEGNTNNYLTNKLDSFVKAENKLIAEDNNLKDTAVKDETEELNSELQTGNNYNSDYKLKGKPDTIVIEFDANNKLLIPGILPSVYAEENPTSDMFVSYSFLLKHDTIFFPLSESVGIEGNELLFDTNKDFETVSVLCDAQAGIFFNEDGSGGMREEFKGEKFDNYPAKQTEEYTYEVPKFEGVEDAFTEDIIAKADAKVKSNELLSYDFKISEVTIEIQYILKGKKYKKTLVFNYEYGD